MGGAASNSNERFAEFVAQYGDVPESKLEHAIASLERDSTRSLGELLVETGAISEEALKKLEVLFAAVELCDDGHSERVGPADAEETQQPESSQMAVGKRPFTTSDDDRFVKRSLHAEGGLGRIYEAHDRQLNRDVALKEMKVRFADAVDSQTRFVKEAEITGRLEHPGIVPVYALGRHADGRPFYTMRMIRGKTLQACVQEYYDNEVMDRATRSIGMRSLLSRFGDVCDAIYYAHRRGVVHRDIKPSNIILGDYGETFVVDWGLAKTLGKRERPQTAAAMPEETTLVPSTGSHGSNSVVGRAIGSPAYMSPEQARGDHDEVSFQSDIYGLGSTLFVILTGAPPIEGRSPTEILAKVRKGRIPKPRTVRRSVPRPLEAICVKAMAYDPEDRYSTVKDMRKDLDRFLADEPVSAHREFQVERLFRLVRRKKWLIAVIAVASVSCLALALLTSLWRVRESAAKQREEQARIQAQRVLDLFVDAFKSANPDRPGVTTEMTARELLEHIQTQIDMDNELEQQPLTMATMLESLGKSLTATGAFDKAAEALNRSYELRKKHVGFDHATMSSANRAAQAYLRSGKLDTALSILKEAVAGGERKLGAADVYVLAAQQTMGTIHLGAKRFDDAISTLEAVLVRLDAEDPHAKHVSANLATAYSYVGRQEEAVKMLDDLVVAMTAEYGENHPSTLSIMHARADGYAGMEKYSEAIEQYRQVLLVRQTELGKSHPDTLATVNRLAYLLHKTGEFAEAISLYEQAIPLSQANDDVGLTLDLMENLAGTYEAVDRHDKAATIRQQLADVKSSETANQDVE